ADGDRDGEVQAEVAVDAAAALDRYRQGAVPGLRGEEARAGVEGDLDRDVGGGDVVAQRLEHKIGQAVAVDVDEVLFGAGLVLGRGEAAAAGISGGGAAGLAVKAGGFGALPPQGAAAGGDPGLRLPEAVTEVEHDRESAARRLHEVGQPVAVDVDEVPVRSLGTIAGV